MIDKKRFKDTAYRAIVRAGIPRLTRRLWLRNQVTILMYHAIIDTPLSFPDWCFAPAASFREQMAFLKRNFEVLSLSEAAARLRQGHVPGPTVVVTFDDGFQNNHDVAFPILQEFEMPATVFLITGLVDSDDTTWGCQVHRALSSTSRTELEWEGEHLDLSTPRGHENARWIINNGFRDSSHQELLSGIGRLAEQLEIDPAAPIEANSPFRMLSSGSIHAMIESGLVEFGAHTHNHVILSCVPDEEIRDEIETSVARVSELTGRACSLFSYPNGRPQDYDARSIVVLEACGVETAVTTLEGGNAGATPKLELRRFGIAPYLNMIQFALRSHHWHGRFGG